MSRDRLDQLANDLKRLQVDFERFFNGALPLPPEELRSEIQKRIRDLRNSRLQGAAENFRLGTLEAQFNTYNELFNRRLRDLEAGQITRPAAGEQRSRHDVEEGVTVAGQVEETVVQALYEGLQSGVKQVKFDMDKFRSYLDQTVGSLRKRTGCQSVTLRLVSDGGEVKLKAKPVKDTDSKGG
jgi:hypothetical protein